MPSVQAMFEFIATESAYVRDLQLVVEVGFRYIQRHRVRLNSRCSYFMLLCYRCWKRPRQARYLATWKT